MSILQDFQQADRVHHRSLGRGTVASVRKDAIEVIYDARYEDRQGVSKNHRGKYDRDWFRICGDLLVKESHLR